jgi:hypothetical protein
MLAARFLMKAAASALGTLHLLVGTATRPSPRLYAKYDRLAATKGKYDPGNVFHRNLIIKSA